jgi:cytochrome c oxidase subunit 4
MADAHEPVPGASSAEVLHGPTLNVYLGVFLALAIFTLMSFGVNQIFTGEMVHVGMAIILGVAVCKATLVGMYFMHLKFDWKKLYFIVCPVLILTTMMVIVLLPDAVVNPHHDPDDQIHMPPPMERTQ